MSDCYYRARKSNYLQEVAQNSLLLLDIILTTKIFKVYIIIIDKKKYLKAVANFTKEDTHTHFLL